MQEDRAGLGILCIVKELFCHVQNHMGLYLIGCFTLTGQEGSDRHCVHTRADLGIHCLCMSMLAHYLAGLCATYWQMVRVWIGLS